MKRAEWLFLVGIGLLLALAGWHQGSPDHAASPPAEGSHPIQQPSTAKPTRAQMSPSDLAPPKPLPVGQSVGNFGPAPARSDEISVNDLVNQLLAETDPDKQDVLRRALASISNPAQVNSLLEHLTTSDDPDVAHGIQLALARMATPAIIRKLGESYQNVENDEAALRIAQAVEWTHSVQCLPALADLMNTPGASIQDRLSRAALYAIANLGAPYSVTILATRMERANEEEAAILTEAMAAIRVGGTVHELLAVAQGLRQETAGSATRVAAIKGLVNYPLTLTREDLEKLAIDADAQVAAAANSAMQTAPP